MCVWVFACVMCVAGKLSLKQTERANKYGVCEFMLHSSLSLFLFFFFAFFYLFTDNTWH